jgi:hypothetical protein
VLESVCDIWQVFVARVGPEHATSQSPKSWLEGRAAAGSAFVSTACAFEKTEAPLMMITAVMSDFRI